eukprot:CAMPEP_0168353850 /NCGR_PEP_ID=MMETSP0213-20121227/23502_1 /TAXON_ID=151035 /ORGANISM="Euplotes harpa, Strain FSP1.4" /LENGTH=141 /DNA_ID=CAMNT_0008365551 /DNA_START=3393 /DNA_END=3817 /DNA_ORIENTATION=-
MSYNFTITSLLKESTAINSAVVGDKANPDGIPISIKAFEGKSEFGLKPIDSFVSAYTTADATVATVTETATPSRSGVGFKPVYFPSIAYEADVAVRTSQLVDATFADNNEGFLRPSTKNDKAVDAAQVPDPDVHHSLMVRT